MLMYVTHTHVFLSYLICYFLVECEQCKTSLKSFALLPAMYQSIQIFVPARGMPATARMQTPHSSDSNLATLRTTPDCYSCLHIWKAIAAECHWYTNGIHSFVAGICEQLVLHAFADNMAYWSVFCWEYVSEVLLYEKTSQNDFKLVSKQWETSTAGLIYYTHVMRI